MLNTSRRGFLVATAFQSLRVLYKSCKMVQYFWILLIKILVLEFDAFKGNVVSAEAFLPPPNDVRLISIDTSTLRLLWSSPNTTNETLTGFYITWNEYWDFAESSSTAFNITNLSTPGKTYTSTISASYASQQNSEIIFATNNTYPSPASNMTVVSRLTNGLHLNWTNSGQSTDCFVWAEKTPSATTSCSTGSKTAIIDNLPLAGTEYTIHIVIQSGQLNSTDSNTTERTNPSPASNMTVVSRQLDSFDLTWTNEGLSDSCFVWVEEAPSATTSCFIGSRTAVITNLPTPGKQYTIHIVIQSGQLNSTISTITERTNPAEPRLTATPLSPYSVLINWTLSDDTETEIETYYNLTITDTSEPTIVIYEHIKGYYNRSVVISGLDAYWNYSVAIVAYIIDEYGEELSTQGAEVVYFQTLESTPGQLQSFDVISLSDDQQCNACEVTWEAPVERDLNGIVTQYIIRWHQVNGADHGSTEVPADQRQVTVRVEPDDKRYNFTIHAKTKAGEGVASTQILPSTGSCLPTPVQNVSSVLMKPSTEDDGSTTNSFTVVYDPNFFQENDNGNITHSGLFVREVPDNENVTGSTEFGNQSLYTDALTWSEAIKHDKIPEYRATEDDWLSDSTSVTKENSSFLSQYIVGDNDTCSKESNIACNGPLPSNREFQVRAIACTRSGCYKTEYTLYIYRTIQSEASTADWIITVATIVSTLVVCIGLAITIYVCRKDKDKNRDNCSSALRNDPKRGTASPEDIKFTLRGNNAGHCEA